MNGWIRGFFSLAASAALAAAFAAAPAAAAVKMIMSNDSQALSFKGKTFEHLKAQIEKELGKEVQVEIHHGGALYDQKTQVQGVQLGGAHLISPTPEIYTSIFPKLNVLALPYLLGTPAAVDTAMKDPMVGEAMLADLEKKGLKTVAIWMNGPRNIGGTKPIITPADIKGVKIRVQPAQVYVDTFKLLGANVTTMSWGEVPTAMQQGVIDAVEPTPNAWLSSKLYETARHITLTGYVLSFYLVSTNKPWWDGLQPSVRAGLQKALDETSKWNWTQADEENEAANKKMQAAGVTLYKLTAAQQKAWVDAVRPVWEKLGNPLVGEKAMKRLEEIGAKYQ